MKPLICHAQAIVANGIVYRNSIIAFDEEARRIISIHPFETETASTESFNGILLAVPAGYKLPALPPLTVSNFREVTELLASTAPHTAECETDIIPIHL